jgi:hypothetical protein
VVILYDGKTITGQCTKKPDLNIGFDFLTSSGLSLNDVSIDVPITYENIIKIGHEITIDTLFKGLIYDIQKDYSTGILTIISRHNVYSLTVADCYAYTSTGRNMALIMLDIIQLFVDEKYIDTETFYKVAGIYSDIKASLTITESDAVSPMDTIATINQMLGTGLYIEGNKIKLAFVNPETITGGLNITENIIITDGKTSYNYDYQKTKVVLTYYTTTDGDEVTASYGDGKSTLSLSLSNTFIITESVAEKIITNAYRLYSVLYESLELIIIDVNYIKVKDIITYKKKAYIVQNIGISDEGMTLNCIGGF